MIIDIHTHLAIKSLYPERYLFGMLETEVLDESLKKNLADIFLSDNSGERFIDQLNKANVDKAVILIIDGGIGINEPESSIEEIYGIHAKVLSHYNESVKERLVVFAGVDPRRDNALEIFKSGIENYGFKGLKLYPPMGYAMDDENLFGIYDICNEYNLPVLIHTGPSLSFLKNDFAEVKNIELIALKYPNISFILAHAGFSLDNEKVREILEIENVYADIAGFQSVFNKLDQYTIDVLGLIFSPCFSSKILFGSDWPLFNLMNPLKNDIEFIRRLYEKVEVKDKNGLNNIFYENSNKILSKINISKIK